MNKKPMEKKVICPYVLNCIPSKDTEDDWTFEDALSAGVAREIDKIPKSVDLREDWWQIRNQKTTGACVGFATADGVLKWYYVKKGMISEKDGTSPRFIWMANKETDTFTAYPTTFLEKSGTQTKLALKIARKYGCVLEEVLPMDGKLSPLSLKAFYSLASKLRISSYHMVRYDMNQWRKWLAAEGPILTRLDVDETWMKAKDTNGHLKTYLPETVLGGHAVSIVGYTKDYFIVRNSWGKDWGDEGFAYASLDYCAAAFDEGYGVIM
jgi:aminopeptidase C